MSSSTRNGAKLPFIYYSIEYYTLFLVICPNISIFGVCMFVGVFVCRRHPCVGAEARRAAPKQCCHQEKIEKRQIGP